MLTFSGVSVVYRGGGGVHDLNLSLASGEVVALIGLNGAGKTTLMRLALGMVRAARGTVSVLGGDVPGLPAAVWGDVGYLVETPCAYPELTVRDNLMIACRMHAADPRCVDAAMAAWSLAPFAGRRFRHLSLGNRQRVGVAAALQHNPRLMILDEPTNGLDPAGVITLREQLRGRADAGASVLVSSHHLDEASRVADRIVVMNAGRLIGELPLSVRDPERRFFEMVRQDDEGRR